VQLHDNGHKNWPKHVMNINNTEYPCWLFYSEYINKSPAKFVYCIYLYYAQHSKIWK